MRVGIITITRDLNYGNRLQNYALQEFLNKYDVQAETILDVFKSWHIKFSVLGYLRGRKLRHFAYYLFNYRGFRLRVKNDLRRQQSFLHFNEKHINFSDINANYDRVPQNLAGQYDYFIVGSDQVWNPNYKCTELEFLCFAPKNKRIAYSASFGVADIPKKEEEKYTQWLKGMEHISVREDAGAGVVQKLTGKGVPVLVDPTLLLNKEEWLRISEKPEWYNGEKYILTYFLGKKADSVCEEIQRIAREADLKIINLLDCSKADFYCIGPGEFVYLVKNCSLMYTDSFHGTVFSILMQVPFIVCDRVGKNGNNMISRIDTLLSLFNLHSRRGTLENNYRIENPLEIEYPNVEEILSVERKRSEKYLKRALNLI